jgi:hypothetical protein
VLPQSRDIGWFIEELRRRHLDDERATRLVSDPKVGGDDFVEAGVVGARKHYGEEVVGLVRQRRR